MKKSWHKWLLGSLIATGLLTAGILAYNQFRVGKPLDSYKGVTVFDNGILFFRSHGKNFSADGYYYGQKWQCVEFIKRFYHQVYRHKMPDVWGHAKSFFDEAIPDGATNSSRGLIQFRNGSVMKPLPDDLFVFADTRYGHVGIVTAVSSNSVEIIQQNIFGATRQKLCLIQSNGAHTITAPRRPIGWLRKVTSS